MSSDEGKKFREHLRLLRESKGLSQSQLEEKIGSQDNYITRVETGRIDTPPVEMTAKIARALGVSLSDLYFVEGVDDKPEILRAKIEDLVRKSDAKLLRKYYRLMLVASQD
ncbi:MAG TPA: helix-turn-helix transcriptional regulator [Terriglobales bacterium]|nr:helix-turn-helix transcriptional regulator [Terriglobales bacterium]